MGISVGQSDSARTKPGLPDGQMNGQVSSAGCLTDDDDSMFGRSLAQMLKRKKSSEKIRKAVVASTCLSPCTTFLNN
ncbi:hypothetical protein AOLI_G00311170 [Acnodon oligacanthus]